MRQKSSVARAARLLSCSTSRLRLHGQRDIVASVLAVFCGCSWVLDGAVTCQRSALQARRQSCISPSQSQPAPHPCRLAHEQHSLHAQEQLLQICLHQGVQ